MASCETNRDWGRGERADVAELFDRAREIAAADVLGRGRTVEVLLRFKAEEFGRCVSTLGGVSGDDFSTGELKGGERMLVKDVNRGRM